jgi:hypothetical protein
MKVNLAVMESAREPTGGELAVTELSVQRRAGRAALRGLMVGAVAAVVMILPLLHLCGALGVLLAAPVAAWFGWRSSVLTLGEQQVACPKCAAVVKVDAGKAGWPVRLHCDACGVSFGATPSPAA